MKRVWFFHGCVISLILLFTFAPILGLVFVGAVADAYNCQVDEGSVHPCMVNGQDWGETLYSLGVLGWLALATLPLGAAALVIYLLLVLVFVVVKRLRQKRMAQV